MIATLVFGLLQVRQFRCNGAMRLGWSWSAPSRTRSYYPNAYQVLGVLPENATAEQFRAAGPEAEEAALALGMRYELLGLLVFREIMPLSTRRAVDRVGRDPVLGQDAEPGWRRSARPTGNHISWNGSNG